MLRLKPGSVRLILVAVALCWVAALFYCIYVRNYEAPAILILAAFFTYFISQRKWASSGKAPDLFKFLRQYGSSPIRELATGLAWLIGCRCCRDRGCRVRAFPSLCDRRVEVELTGHCLALPLPVCRNHTK
jgi:hypothetical protein